MANIVLTGDTSGAITVAAPAVAGTNTITLPASTGTLATTATAGKILQVISATKTDTQSITARGLPLTDVTGLSISITPSATSSKILVLANINLSSNERYSGVILYNGSTALCIGDAASARKQISSGIANSADGHDQYQIFPSAINFLHSPSSTSAQTYKIGAGQFYPLGSGTVQINRSSNDGDDQFLGRTASTITVMEVAG